MKKIVSTFSIFLLAIACYLTGILLQRASTPSPTVVPIENREDPLDSMLAKELARSLSEATKSSDEGPPPYALPLNALARSTTTINTLHEDDINPRDDTTEIPKSNTGYKYLDNNNNYFIISKMGKDYKLHFQNSFLVGYKPFDVSKFWMPHYVISMRMKYQFDKDQFPGYTEIWLSSHEAFQTGRGDCEDHAIALADWLIEMGEDARVVAGDFKGRGHAWVVVIRDTGSFVLEATSKRKNRVWSAYPLAQLATDYVPKSMFNRDDFWMTEDVSKSTDYTGPHWKKTATVVR